MLSVLGDIPYWIVQNTWGTAWGDEGYVYIKIGGNICGKYDLCPLWFSVYLVLFLCLYVAVPASPLGINTTSFFFSPSSQVLQILWQQFFFDKILCIFCLCHGVCLCEWLCVFPTANIKSFSVCLYVFK